MGIAEKIVSFCEAVYDTEFSKEAGAANIVYLEGATADLIPNIDAPDIWNDRCLIISYQDGRPFIRHNSPATSEPGTSATQAKRSKKLGGVARISIGFHKEKWVLGHHKKNSAHPALVQCAPITVHRDKNGDGKRTGDPITQDVLGLNQHGTRPGLRSLRVGEWSYGCLVRQYWEDHMAFVQICQEDPRAVSNKKFKFSATVADFSKLYKTL